MKRNIILPDKIIRLAVVILPERLPPARVSRQFRILDRRRQVPDHRLKPDVQAFPFLALDRNRNAPVQIAGNRPSMQVVRLNRSQRLPDDVRAPAVLTRFQERDNRPLKLPQIQIEMLRVAELRNAPIRLRSRVQDLFRLQQITALVALIPAGVLIAANITGPFNISVRKELSLRNRIPLLFRRPVQIAVFPKRQKNVLRNLKVILRMRTGKKVIRNPDIHQHIQKTLMETLVNLRRRRPLVLSANRNRRPMRVGPGQNNRIIAHQAMRPAENIRRQVRPGQIPNMNISVSVRPGRRHQNRLFFHNLKLLRLKKVPETAKNPVKFYHNLFRSTTFRVRSGRRAGKRFRPRRDPAEPGRINRADKESVRRRLSKGV